MPFVKGISGNPAGKPVGRKSNESEESIRNFLKSKSEEYFYGTSDDLFSVDIAGLKGG